MSDDLPTQAKTLSRTPFSGSVLGHLTRHCPVLTGAVSLFLILCTVYSLSIGIRATRGASITGDEPFYLVTTQSLLQDGNLDLSKQYAARSYESFFDHPDGLWHQSIPAPSGRILSPHDPGLSVLLLPGFAIDGLRGAQVQLLFIAATTFALAYVLAASETKAPLLSWLATLAVGVTATAFVYSTEVYPELPAALCLVLSLLLLRRSNRGAGAGLVLLALLTALAWLGIKYVPLGLMIATVFVYSAGWRSRAIVMSLGALSGIVYVWFHYATFGELTPYNYNLVYQGASTGDVLQHHLAFEERIYRLWGLFIDRRFGIGHWAPILLLLVPALPLLFGAGSERSGPLALWERARVRVPTPSPSQGEGRGEGRSGPLVAALILTQLLIATFLAITMMGWWFPGRTLLTVLPLAPLVLTVLLTKVATPLRLAIGVLALWSAATTAALAIAGHRGEIVLAVDPFAMRSQVFEAASSLYPDYRAWTIETVLLTAAWLTVLIVTTAICTRLAGFTLPNGPITLPHPRLRLQTPTKAIE